MHPRLLDYYSQEYAHLRDMGQEFARQFPKVASRLTLDSPETPVPDPYVERLLEGFSFLAARVQLKLDAQFPRFTQHLLEMVYPHYLAPTPAMAIARFRPTLSEGNLAAGFALPAGTALHARAPGLGAATPAAGATNREDTACEFRTAHEVMLWPLEIRAVRYQLLAPDLPLAQGPWNAPVRAVLRIRLGVTAGLACSQLQLDRLAFYFSGRNEQALKLYEAVFGSALGVMLAPPQRPLSWFECLPVEAIQPLGFSREQALIPYDNRSFSGYRLLHEYFAFPERLLFMELRDLRAGFARHDGNEIDLVIPLCAADAQLESLVDAQQLSLYCTPAINLFARDCDRIDISDQRSEHQVVVDRAHPMDYEVYKVREVSGYAQGSAAQIRFSPFYASLDGDERTAADGHFTLRREPRMLSVSQKRYGARSGYVGNEAFLSLVSPGSAPYPVGLRQIGVRALVTNRDLPLLMPIGTDGDFSLKVSAPVEGIRCLRGPSRPIEPLAERDTAWRLISHLSLNYLSLTDLDPQRGAAALRELLGLYAVLGSDASKRQIEGIRHVSVTPCTRRLPQTGPIVFARGLAIRLLVNETAFAGASAFLLGAVLERFFVRHASMNTFTEFELASETRGEIKRWKPRAAARAIA